MPKFDVTVSSRDGIGSIEFEEPEAESADEACDLAMDAIEVSAEESEDQDDN